MTLAAAVVLVVAATTVFTLFIRAKDIPPPDPVSPTRFLDERKAAIYENLRDLQFEFRVGKLSDADYQQTKLALQKELAVVLAEIDKIAPPKPPAPKPQPSTGTICPHCGAKFAKNMKFCGECGKAIS
ncbi:MAG: zinc ribbon domain-containing protein [Bryobacteraceae bacterium]